MSEFRLLRVALALCVAAFIGLLSYSWPHAINHAQEYAYSRDLKRVQAVNAELNQSVLRARSALLAQYDPLVSGTRELARLLDALEHPPAFVGARGRAELYERLTRARAELASKAELIETFKTHNSVLQNSLRYFPVLATSLLERARAADGGAGLALPVQSLIGAVMLFETSADPESTARLTRARDELAAAREAASTLGLSTEVELSLAHSRVVLDRKPLVDDVVRRILAVPLTRRAAELEERYSAQYRAAMDRALTERQISFGLALLIAILVFAEVTLRIRRSADQLREATLQLREANRALYRERERERQLGEQRSRFATMTSHEFRNPLAAIISSADMLEDYGERWTPEHRVEHLERIRSKARDMRRMLEDILLIGKAEAGMLHPVPGPLDLDQFCRGLAQDQENASAGAHAIHFTFEGDPQAVLDTKLLREALGNLLGNALKYSPPGSQVRFDVVSSGTGHDFTISDQGIGIPADAIPRLGESFFRASNAQSVNGSGLGLAVVKRAVEVQGGTLAFESQVGRGSTFRVSIPRQRDSAPNEEAE